MTLAASTQPTPTSQPSLQLSDKAVLVGVLLVGVLSEGELLVGVLSEGMLSEGELSEGVLSKLYVVEDVCYVCCQEGVTVQ